MALRQNLLSTLKTQFESSPVSSNAIFGLILFGLEKIVEWEFACPCNPKINPRLASAFFVAPTVVIFLLMIAIQECSCEKFFLSLVPTSCWLSLVFLDGNYFACAKTNWSGKYVKDPESPHFKWCKPGDETLTEEYLKTTQYWFAVSQTIGIWLIILYAVPLGCLIFKRCCMKFCVRVLKNCQPILKFYECCKTRCKECRKKLCEDTEDENNEREPLLQNMEVFSLTVRTRDQGYFVSFELQP